MTSKRGGEFWKVSENITSVKQWILNNKQFNPYLDDWKSDSIFKANKKETEEKPEIPKIDYIFPISPDITDARIVKWLDNLEINDWQREIDIIKQNIIKVWHNETRIHSELVNFMSGFSSNELTDEQKEILISLKDISPIDPIFEINFLNQKLNTLNQSLQSFCQSNIILDPNTIREASEENDSWESTFENSHQV